MIYKRINSILIWQRARSERKRGVCKIGVNENKNSKPMTVMVAIHYTDVPCINNTTTVFQVFRRKKETQS